MAYKAKHNPAMLNSILYLSCILMFVLLPIAGVILEIARENGEEVCFLILWWIPQREIIFLAFCSHFPHLRTYIITS